MSTNSISNNDKALFLYFNLLVCAPDCLPLFIMQRIQDVIIMNTKNFSKIICAVFIAACVFTTANASPRNKNSTAQKTVKAELKAARKIAQQAQMEAAYIRLMGDGKGLNKKHQAKNKAKPRKIKVALKQGELESDSDFNQRLRVTATAYTSHVNQTDSTPNIAAWGDRLKPGMKAIAVSRDLLKVYGLKHKQKVRIKGLKGEYVVLDKMNKRWRKKIDIYMGMNKRKALRWGRRKVEILWNS